MGALKVILHDKNFKGSEESNDYRFYNCMEMGSQPCLVFAPQGNVSNCVSCGKLLQACSCCSRHHHEDGWEGCPEFHNRRGLRKERAKDKH